MIKHLVSSGQFKDSRMLEEIFQRTDEWERWDQAGTLPKPLQDKVIACLFFEPSTRTRFSFETAALKLGAKVISSENAGQFGSSSKGETLEDTIRVVNGYADAIVMRHYIQGAARRAARVSEVPIINAGDGAGEHPTQALLDFYTMRKELGKIEGLRIALVGDLLYGRTVHSLLNLAMLYKSCQFFLISPPRLAVPQKIRAEMQARGVKFRELQDFGEILGKIDVLYMTRVQKERFASENDYNQVKDVYQVDKALLRKLNKQAIIMHPLPRITEIAPEVDHDKRAAYFRQAKNGLYLRMAILEMLVR
ncbi:MAG: aspartate carbamoyltransferase [bacterium]|nr:aspartate carbamoyltransferase [bacterium]